MDWSILGYRTKRWRLALSSTHLWLHLVSLDVYAWSSSFRYLASLQVDCYQGHFKRSVCLDQLKSVDIIKTKILFHATEFVAFDALTSSMKKDPNFLSPRAFLIASYALCGFGNISSAGINIGIMVALAPNRSVDIIQLVPRALIVGIIATLSTACIAGKFLIRLGLHIPWAMLLIIYTHVNQVSLVKHTLTLTHNHINITNDETSKQKEHKRVSGFQFSINLLGQISPPSGKVS